MSPEKSPRVARDGQSYSYVIVGGGTAGCVLARRLAEDPSCTVLLLEAGGTAQPPSVDVPARWLEATGSSIDWGVSTLPQIGAGGMVMYVPRGKVLGGSSVINAMVHHAGTAQDFDRWTDLGATGWGAPVMARHFKQVEDWRGRADPRRGTTGPIVVTPVEQTSTAVLRFIEGGASLGHPIVEDLNADPGVGLSLNQLAFDGRHRMSSARAYLRSAADFPNLTIRTLAQVLKLDIAGDRCVGVRYLNDGRSWQAQAEREVILAAGAIHSPQLLLLSGIGAVSALRPFAIRQRVDLNSVGDCLQEHVLFSGHAIETQTGFPPSCLMGTDAVLYARSRHAVRGRDIMLNFAVGLPGDPMAPGCRTSFSFLKPRSRGRIGLRSADPLSAPAVDPGIFGNSIDLDGVEDALEMSRSILNGPAFRDIFVREIYPGIECATRSRVRDTFSRASLSFGHWGGSCRMGSDDDAVVDPSLRVRGVDNLRVADASVMPELPGAPTNATILALAERAADLIALDRRGQADQASRAIGR